MDRPERPTVLPPEVVAELAAALEPVPVPDSARARSLARVMAHARTPGTRVLLAGEGEWVPLVKGIRIKTLRRDEQTGTQTSLWRLEPGARVPPHSHRHEEECLVLEGSVIHEGRRYGPGDFLHALPGSRHSPFESPDGALLMIRSELVPKLGWWTRALLRLINR